MAGAQHDSREKREKFLLETDRGHRSLYKEPMIGQGKSRQEEHRTQRGRRGKDRSLLRKLEGSAEQQEGIEPIVHLCVRRLREELCDDHRPSVATTQLQSARRGPAMAWHAQARARAHRPTRPWHSGPGSGRRRGFLADGPRGRVQPRRRGCDPTTGSGAGHGGAGSYRPRAVQDTASPGAAQAGASGPLGRLPARARPSSASARSALVHGRPQPRPRRGGTASPDVGAAARLVGGGWIAPPMARLRALLGHLARVRALLALRRKGGLSGFSARAQTVAARQRARPA